MTGSSTNESCPHRPPCSACPRFAERGIAPTAQGVLDELAHRHGLAEVPVISGDGSGFRVRARLAIRGRLGSPKVGLFELDSHRVVHIPNCVVHHALINRVAAVVRRALVDAHVTSYSDAVHLGVARYLQVVVERSSQTAQVTLVANSATPEPLTACLDLIRGRLGSSLHSLWFNANCQTSNTILGPTFHHWCGRASVVERFGGGAVHYPPGAFGQSNLGIAQAIIEHMRLHIPLGARVAEFYAGVGAVGLSLVDRVGAIQMNEISPQALHGLELGVAALDHPRRLKVTMVPGEAGRSLAAAHGAEVVIVDPPRKGLDPPLLEYLSEEGAERLIYISCALDSMLKDTERLVSRKRLRLVGLTAFNLMPYTRHVETVARFERG